MTAPDDPLPDRSVDETDTGWGEQPGHDDRHLVEERPPHHDR